MNLAGHAISSHRKVAGSSWPPVNVDTKLGWKCATMARNSTRTTTADLRSVLSLDTNGAATEGTGLGLAITARLVELHRSKLEIESKQVMELAFIFSSPSLYSLWMSPPGQPKPHQSGKTPRILIVEDNAATGQLIQSQTHVFRL